MLFVGLIKFKKMLTAEVAAENVKDIEDDEKAGVRVLGIYWTLGQYDTVILFEAADERAAMNMALKRVDRMEFEILVAMPAVASSPSGPA
jgi:uncharacterized protein with GYD domain